MDRYLQPSSVVSRHAAASSDSPIATDIAMDILRRGGNAADAAVAAITAVSVVQPLSCGIGGDIHCLFYRRSDKSVRAVNGSGRTGRFATLDKLLSSGCDYGDSHHGLYVSVPGAVAGMFSVVKHFGSGKLTMKDILDPSIKLAHDGVPVPFKGATKWRSHQEKFMTSRYAHDLLVKSRTPEPGELFRSPTLAKSLANIALHGPESFYKGDMASNIAAEVQYEGGVLDELDLEDHLRTAEKDVPKEAVSVDYKGFRIWEMKPNPMGIVVLVAFNVLRKLEIKALGHNSPEYIHIVSEVTKHAYQESWDYLCDPDHSKQPLSVLLSEDTADRIMKRINAHRPSNIPIDHTGGNTSYVCVVDGQGNGCSFISSISSSFGSGIIPKDCGFPLHDRAKLMNHDEESANCFGPKKLPLHTIIPSLVTDPSTNDLIAVFGVVGRWMQPQGHIQVLLNMILFGMDPQVALNQPRFFVGNPYSYSNYIDELDVLCLESSIDPSVVPFLESKGYSCKMVDGPERWMFGAGHVISRTKLFDENSPANDIWWSGADPRSDGSAAGF